MLAGGLSVILDPNYTPAQGDQDQFMTYGSRSGSFGSVSGTNARGGLRFVLQYDPGDATLMVRRTRITLSPTAGAAGSSFQIAGVGFSPGEAVSLTFGSTSLAAATANGSGQFVVMRRVPNVAAGTYAVTATGRTSFVGVGAPFVVT